MDEDDTISESAEALDEAVSILNAKATARWGADMYWLNVRGTPSKNLMTDRGPLYTAYAGRKRPIAQGSLLLCPDDQQEMRQNDQGIWMCRVDGRNRWKLDSVTNVWDRIR